MSYRKLLCVGLLIVAWGPTARAADWPTFRHDNHRSGQTAESIAAEQLEPCWTEQSPHPPQPAWAGPAKWDAFAGIRGLRSMRNYDPVFHVAVAGKRLYFGSSVDGSVRCHDTTNGQLCWTFQTDGPVRIAPTIVGGRVYFGSDDGYAYCVDAEDGELVWKHCPGSRERLILNNGRLIPLWPCRTGVMVEGTPGQGGTAYFAAGMLPWKESYFCAVDAATGEVEGPGRYAHTLGGTTTEGAWLASSNRLYVPQGRVPPLVFDRETGKSLGSLDGKGGGGCFIVLTDDDRVLHGPGNKTGWISESNAETKQRLASFSGGNAMVVAGEHAYLLTDDRLSAIDRQTKKPAWNVPCDCPFELISAGDTLFVGGRDKVCAVDTADGATLWEGKVFGRAHGLAVADGALFVSTDEGAIHCFRPTGKPKPTATVAKEEPAEEPAEEADPPAPIAPFKHNGLLGRWVFHRDAVEGTTVKDLAGNTPGTISGTVTLGRVGDTEAIELDGTTGSVSLAADHNTAKLPTRQITAEAWVRVDAPLQWGGILGALQDNGSYERGWVLGYSQSRFSFAVAGKEGPGSLTYLAADADFQLGTGHHVVGTYDGTVMKVYVDGQLRATSTVQKGDINYPPKAPYELGAYRDQDEFFRLRGMIHEARLYDRVLSAEEIQEHHKSKPLDWPVVDVPPPPPTPAAPPVAPESLQLALGPYLRFTAPGEATVRWQTDAAGPTILEYEVDGQWERIEKKTAATEHVAELQNLRTRTVYPYRIKVLVDGEEEIAGPFECDTFFDYTTERGKDAPQDGDRGGLCLMLGCGDGKVACQLAGQRGVRVIMVHSDQQTVRRLRGSLTSAGVHGACVTVQHVDSYTQLPITGGLVNLIMVDGAAEGVNSDELRAEVDRLLSPGGVAVLGTTVTDPKPSSAGAWTHQYGLPDNSAFGGETLGGARTVADLDVQWIGRPGPRAQPDRNGRKPSPLSADGKLFMQGLHRMIALDAYNGTILWSLEIPPLERFNMPRDCGNWCVEQGGADGRVNVFAAIRDKCWRIDGDMGEVKNFFDVVPGPRKEWAYDWGYIARPTKDHLIGSAVKAGSSRTNFWGGGGAGWYDSKAGAVTHPVCGDNLFSMHPETGKTRWTYTGGVILHPTITVAAEWGEAGGRVFFVECRNEAVVASDSRRVAMPEIWQDQFLVCLDLASGKKLWEKPIDTADGTVVFYMAHSDGKLVIAASDNRYHVYAFDAADGKPLWEVEFPWPSDNHGKHMSRPAIVGGKVFVRPGVIDLASGKLLDTKMPDGGCGTYACTEHAVIYRAGNVTMWDHEGGPVTSFNRLRPGCWLSTIPGCGMLLSPEAGGGCSCGKWLETSVGFAPVRK